MNQDKDISCIFKDFDDGWFKIKVCSKCGAKIQLSSSKAPLPAYCPQCKSFKYEFINKET